MSGTLCGGNLTVFASLLGTPYEPDTGGCILFWKISGKRHIASTALLHRSVWQENSTAAAVFFSALFPGCNPPHRGWRSCEEIIKETAAAFSVPVVSGLPCGHSAPQSHTSYRCPLQVSSPFRMQNDTF